MKMRKSIKSITKNRAKIYAKAVCPSKSKIPGEKKPSCVGLSQVPSC